MLALRFDKLLAAGVVKDFRTLARLGYVSPARISQIMSLLHLSPDIQEAILFCSRPERGWDCLDLRKVLPLTQEWDWHKQRRPWRKLSAETFASKPLTVTMKRTNLTIRATVYLLFGRINGVR